MNNLETDMIMQLDTFFDKPSIAFVYILTSTLPFNFPLNLLHNDQGLVIVKYIFTKCTSVKDFISACNIIFFHPKDWYVYIIRS